MKNLEFDITGYAERLPGGHRVDMPDPSISSWIATVSGSRGRSAGPKITRSSKIFIVAFIAALPAIAGFVMWISDPADLTDFYETKMGQTLFYAGFIWIGIGMLAVRRAVSSRTRPSSAS